MITPQHCQAKRKRDDGEEREIHVPRHIPPHPSRGGVTGYSVSHRQHCLSIFNAGLPLNGNFAPSLRSVRRWNERIFPYHPTGNKSLTKFTGVNIFLLYVYRHIFPRANADEVSRFLLENSPQPVFFSRKDICLQDQRLGFTRKRASITARQALRDDVLVRRRLFWTEPPPLGIRGVDIDCLIDIDEMKINLQSTNRSVGKAPQGSRVRDIGAYGHDVKYTLILAIGPNNFKHMSFEQIPGDYYLHIIK